MKFYIETDRLILRELQKGDLQAWFEMDSDPAVHKYLGNNPVKNIEHIENAFQSIQQQYAENGIGRWAVIEKSSGDFMGWSGIKFMRQTVNGKIDFHEVGYRFLQKYWGKGYATESAKAAVRYGFEEMQLQEIYGITNVENINSKKVLEKCGLQLIETFVWESYDNMECNWLKTSKGEWERYLKQLTKSNKNNYPTNF